MRNITVDIVLVTLILAIFVGYFIGINLTVKKYVTDGLKLVEDYTRNEEWAEALKASKDLKELWNKYKYLVMFNFGELDFSDFDHHLNHIIGGLEDQQLDSTLSNILSAKDLWANLEKIVPEP